MSFAVNSSLVPQSWTNRLEGVSHLRSQPYFDRSLGWLWRTQMSEQDLRCDHATGSRQSDWRGLHLLGPQVGSIECAAFARFRKSDEYCRKARQGNAS